MKHAVIRFPGGKHPVRRYLADMFDASQPYLEPFAGGASVALEILERGAPHAVLNDADRTVIALWRTIQQDPTSISLPETPTVSNFYDALATLEESTDPTALASAKILVQRCSMGGYGKGPIGGKDQSGRYPITARWNPENIRTSINQANKLLQRASILEQDAILTMQQFPTIPMFVDPPYVKAGPTLYRATINHVLLRETIVEHRAPYVLTIDQDDYLPNMKPLRIAGNRRVSQEWYKNTHDQPETPAG